jgi:pyruvate/2-oxoglutarate/acetoin dehydrogenase E1 component
MNTVLADRTLELGNSSSFSYFGALTEAMYLCAEEEAILVGQGVGPNKGTTMSQTLDGLPFAQRLEFPVAEDFQMGFCIGLSLDGRLPVAIYPRWNFLLLAANQLINHLDRLPLYSTYQPKMIIRTAIPSTMPFDPGPQHNDDFTQPFSEMLRTVQVVRLKETEQIVPAYKAALESPVSTLLVEYTDQYKNERARQS